MMNEPQVPIMLTIKEASLMSGLSYDAIRKLCLCNQIIHIRIGTKYFINRIKFIEFLEEGRKENA